MSLFWITGLSGAGKTTLCHKLVRHLRQPGHPVIMLDGDDLRALIGATSAVTRAERLDLAFRYARICKHLVDQGIDVAIATISLFHEVHSWNRENIDGYVEIFLDVPLEELQRRDPKGIYERARLGAAKDVAGLDLPVDRPTSPDVTVSWNEGHSADDTFRILLKGLNLEHRTL